MSNSAFVTVVFAVVLTCSQAPQAIMRRQQYIEPLKNISKTHLTLAEIFQKTGTDKLWRHGYHHYYEKELAPYRDIDGLRILEIGADSGISLGAWMDYFKNPESVQGVAYKVDANAAKKKACEIMPDACERLQIYSLDQSDVNALANMVQQNPAGWDIIIDDGSHLPQHQLISFQRLWPNIRPGGLYVIEDIETSYVDKGSVYAYPLHAGVGVDPPFSAVEQFKRLVDVVNRKHFGHPELTVFDGADKDVAGVNFGDGLIFVQKKPADPDWDKYPQRVVYGPPNVDSTVNLWKQKLVSMNKWFKDPKYEQ